MKRCPKCGRSFPDEDQKYCTIDGGRLVTTDKLFDPNATIQGTSADLGTPSAEPPKEKPASSPESDFGATIATSSSAPTAVFPRKTGPTGSPISSSVPPPPTMPPPSPAATQPLPQAQSAPLHQSGGLPSSAAVAPLPAAPEKKSKLPLILGILALLFMFGAAALIAGLYFFLVKPRRDAMQARPPVVVKQNQNENLNNNTNTNSEEAKTEGDKTESEFVAPPNTTQFTNSQTNLDGKLAEHYLDFSFYYPDSWDLDPKAGVSGASNFAKVERRLPPDFTQENFAVGWYTSKGTFAADESTFPQLVAVLSTSLARNFPGYRKVSEGPTKINSLDAYEFRWAGLSKGTEKGDLQLWGRVVFVPTGVAGDSNGATLTMFTTSLAPELSSVEDVGSKGELPIILESFRFGKGH